MQALSSLIANYLETGQYEKQLSPDTIKAYRIDLRQFSDFTKGVWADKDMLDRYIKYLRAYSAILPERELSEKAWETRPKSPYNFTGPRTYR